MAKIGYARVSTVKQDLSEQIAALEKFGCEKIFFGKFSGKAKDEDFNTILRRVAQSQIQLNNMLNYVREGDVVVVTKLDRLGRSLIQCLKTLKFCTHRRRFMNYALIGALLFLTSSYLISSLKGKDRKVKVKAILSYLGFFLLFGIFMLTYHSASSNLSENPIIQKITH